MSLTCQCGAAPVIRGAIFCWNATCQLRVGRYTHLEGQVVWTTNPEVRGSATMAFAVLVGEEQRQVSVTNAEPSTNNAELNLTLNDASAPRATLRIADLVRISSRAEPEEQVVATLLSGG